MRRIWLLVWLALLLVFLGAVLVSLLGLPWFASVDASGSIQQTPLLYLVLMGVVLLTILVLRLSLSHEAGAESLPFSARAFVNVFFSAVLLGGMVHELVHLILLRHPTQFRIHFGDSNAIFSTCCLLPGELPYEEVAYAIQFIFTIAWIWYFRKMFMKADWHLSDIQFPHLWKTKPTTPTKSIPSAHPADVQAEDEWKKEKAGMERWLSPQPKTNTEKSKTSEEDVHDALSDLEKMRIQR